MARVKPTKHQNERQNRRTSWTRFHLPREQDWPTWSADHADIHRGPLTDVEGCRTVSLGRKVEDPEQAALIVEWKSAAALKDFCNSPACDEFLRCLPESDAQTSLESGALLRDLSLGSDADGASSSSVPSRFPSYQWTGGYSFEDNLQGRITLTALAMPYMGGRVPDLWWTAIDNALSEFLPKGCEDLSGRWTPLRMHFWTAWAWIDASIWQPERRVATAESEGDQSIVCQFRRWNGYSGATPEREEASAVSTLARESWAERLATVMPPVTAWEQERWDIWLAPRAPQVEDEKGNEGYEEDTEFERKLNEFIAAGKKDQMLS